MIEKLQALVLLSAMAYLCYGAALLINDRNNRK
jgi:hypothetical protein